MSDDKRHSGGGKGRPPRGSGFSRDRKGPPRDRARSEGRGFKGLRAEGGRGERDRREGGRPDRERFSDRRSEGRFDRPASGDATIRGAFRPRKPREEGGRFDQGPANEGRSSSAPRERDGSKRRFSPSKGPRRSFGKDASQDKGERPSRERPPRDRSFGDRPPRERRFDRPRSDQRGADRRGSDRRPNRSDSRPAPKPRPGDRIAKVMARAGLCSRRDAETWILAGRVIVNGETLTSPARDIVPTDKVEVDGQPLPLRERTRLFLYHKPRGLVTTARDPEGRPTVFANLPKGLPRLISVGRLDINTEGLLLLTNDGGLARIIELPETEWLRRYRVRCYGEIDQATLDTLKAGVTIDGMNYGPIEATLDREKGDNVWLTLGLREGKNREVKRVLEHFGLAVNRLIRVSFGPFQLGELEEGRVEEVRTGFLRHQISPEMSTLSGVDFDGPIFNHDEDFDDIAPKKFERREERSRGPRREEGRPPRREFDRDDRGAPRGDRKERAPRFEPAILERGAEEKPARPQRPHRNEVQKKIWRADDVQDHAAKRSAPKIPRRGFDPKKARAENAERGHERAGRIETRSGKSVKVEKLSPRSRPSAGRTGASSKKGIAPSSRSPRPPRGR